MYTFHVKITQVNNYEKSLVTWVKGFLFNGFDLHCCWMMVVDFWMILEEVTINEACVPLQYKSITKY